MGKWGLVLSCTLVLWCAPAFGQNRERITDFHSDIVIKPDSTLLITETIQVHSLGHSIKHGIYRDFPTGRQRANGGTYTVSFRLLDIQRDGHPEPYHVTTNRKSKRIYIGSKNRTLPPGDYTYTIRYKTGFQIGFFKSHDELYWNVTGTQWQFPIDHASATIHLPGPVDQSPVNLTGYTGPKGAKGRNWKATLVNPTTASFETRTPLSSHAGLTAVVSFPKGLVTPPSLRDKFAQLVQFNHDTMILFLGVLLLLGYYIVA